MSTTPQAVPARAAVAGSPGLGDRALSEALREEVAQLLVAEAQRREEAGLSSMTAHERRAVGERLLSEAMERHTTRLLGQGWRALDSGAETRALRAAHDALFGLGGLQALLDNELVENIHANGCDTVFVRFADGRKEQVAPIAASDAELVELIRTVAARGGSEERRFDRAVPRLNVQLPDGSRMFAVMAVSGRVSLSIRRHRYPRATLPEGPRVFRTAAVCLKATLRAACCDARDTPRAA
ncbi:type IV secretory pathway ATPase VirB11/archaellum biosynthesis ATPase, partial [Kitasatospora sp. MAP5-34]|nr:type IV secretory pathway ATPase VirB11/archaellum biosynthesis ATPase [Kitasatospora sp. MAP5-34]